MPYPVLPPSPPPIIDVLPTGAAQSPPSHATASESREEALPVRHDQGPIASQPPEVIPAAGCAPNCKAVANAEAANSAISEVGTLALEGESSAALLGSPIAIDQTSNVVPTEFSARDLQSPPSSLPSLLPSSTVAPNAAFLPLPDLDAIRQLPNPVQPARRARSTSSTPAPQVAQAPSITPTDSIEPSRGYTGDSIRLDLPIPDPLGTNDSAPEPTQSTTQPDGLEQPITPDLPQPIPQPSGGQILNIPTSPRTREEETTEPTPSTPPAPGNPPTTGTPPIDLQQQGDVLEVTADQQEIDERRQVFRADGDVVVRFRQAILSANRVRVNIPNRVAVAEGDAVLTRGDQVLGGDRFEFNFGRNQGRIQGARGQLLIPATERDFNADPLATLGDSSVPQAVTTRVSSAQPLQVLGGTPGLSFGVGDLPSSSQTGPGINRLRFEADQAVFDGADLVAENVRLTNDPFSPPELELRSSRVTYTRLSPFVSEIRARNPRLVFDQGFSLPLLVNRIVLDNRRRDSGLLNFGFDEEDRDGFYIERSFNLYTSPVVDFTVTPQILVQRAIEQGDFPDPDHFGLVANLDLNFTPTTTAQAVANFSSLDFEDIGDNLRASFRAQQRVFNHTVSAEYSYRNRLFNGSLGFQTVQSSIGLVVASPLYILGDSQINLRYQGSLQYINAETDQRDLLPLDRSDQFAGISDQFLPLDPDRDKSCIDEDDRALSGNGCADLTRYQTAVTLSRFFPIWSGTALPATPTEGLRYTPTPIVPYVGVYVQARGVYSGYSSGDSQASLQGGAVLLGQFGHFSRPFLDYTAFSLGYFNTLKDGESPFLFDRIGDEQFVTMSLTQQIYGPLRAGVQFSYNLDTEDDIDTVYTLEYSRRTYSILASYSTGRQSGYLTFRLNDFNWTGDPGPFSGLGSNFVESGLIRGIN